MLLRRIRITRFSISPLDDRYLAKLLPVESVFSEKNLMRSRVKTEISWLKCLVKNQVIPSTKINCEANEFNNKLNRFDNFTEVDYQAIKKIESVTNHDVKAVEYFVKEELAKLGFDSGFREYVHFLCTSEDINNIAYSLMLTEYKTSIYQPGLGSVIGSLKQLANESKTHAMISLTHGQTATPTTMGKEMANFAMRLHRQLGQIESVKFQAKMNGATGNFNSHYLTEPNVGWIELVRGFIEKDLGLEFNLFTTQIEPHDSLCEFFSRMSHVNTIGIGLTQDLWGYISRGYFKLKVKKGEVGSSVMPHKVNPIDLENAEGNFGVANGLLEYFCRKLPISRFQRDLSDSTVLRNIGVAAGHTMLGFNSLNAAFGKMKPCEETMRNELGSRYELLTEPVQQVLRREGHANAYELLKDFSRGEQVTKEGLAGFIDRLEIDKTTKEKLQKLAPENFIGKAAHLVDEMNRLI